MTCVYPDYAQVNWEDLKGKEKTGDLLLFKALDNMNAPMIGCFFTHVGVIWVDPMTGISYVFEIAPARNMPLRPYHNKNGVFLSRLEDRVLRYKGYLAYKRFEGSVSNAKAYEFVPFIQYATQNFKYEYRPFQNAIRKFFGQKINSRMNCGELAYVSLIKLGILPPEAHEKSVGHHLRKIVYMENTPSGKYATPFWIDVSPF